MTRDSLVSTESWGDCHLAHVLKEGGWVVAPDLEGGSPEAHGPGPSTFFTASVLWEGPSSVSGRTWPLSRPLANCLRWGWGRAGAGSLVLSPGLSQLSHACSLSLASDS